MAEGGGEAATLARIAGLRSQLAAKAKFEAAARALVRAHLSHHHHPSPGYRTLLLFDFASALAGLPAPS